MLKFVMEYYCVIFHRGPDALRLDPSPVGPDTVGPWMCDDGSAGRPSKYLQP